MALNIEPPPISTPLITKNGIMQRSWVSWLLLGLLAQLQSVSSVRVSFLLPAANAASGPTPLIPVAAAGFYRVTWHLRISVVDGVASSVQITVNSTEGGNAIQQSGAAVTGDTLTTVQSGSVTVQADGGSLLSYTIAYSSNTPAKMAYVLSLSVEQLNG